MKVSPTALPEVLVLEPTVFRDARGFFLESWNRTVFKQATGVDAVFVQDNHSHSKANVLRGIHYQLGKPQGKLVRVTSGAIVDAAVDLRRASPNFGKWVLIELGASDARQIWIPPGFGHAFLVLSEAADVEYKTTEHWFPHLERSIAWDDPDLGIAWPVRGAPLLAPKDAAAPRLEVAEVFQ
jgi:dTDP-4-dehydrorhamnose 3,5-epimerase